jgi:bloom syndrome protein
MMESFHAKEKITLNNLVDCFRGKGGSSTKNLSGNRYFGVGKDWAKAEAERLVQLMMLEGAFDEYYVKNMAGWNNSYLRVSSTAVARPPGLNCDRPTRGSPARS